MKVTRKMMADRFTTPYEAMSCKDPNPTLCVLASLREYGPCVSSGGGFAVEGVNGVEFLKVVDG